MYFASLELYDTISGGEKRIVPTTPDIESRLKLGPALTHNNRPGPGTLATIKLDPPKLRIGIATVLAGPLPLLMSHGTPQNIAAGQSS